jgi:hypothetical protein
MSTVTPEQQQAAFQFVADFQKALLPARLADTNSNGVIIAAELNKRGWAYNVENAIKVVNEILFKDVLEWKVEPAKLQADRRNKANVRVEPNVRKDEEELAKRKVAVEAADKKNAEDEKTFARIEGAIAAFSPRRLSTKYAEQEKLRAHVEAEKKRNASPEGVFEVVKTYIEKFYRDEERKLERM